MEQLQSLYVKMTIESVEEVRIGLCREGFKPIAIWSHTTKSGYYGSIIRSPGKQPVDRDWHRGTLEDPWKVTKNKTNPDALNTGILTDDLRIVDMDIDDRDKVETIHRIAIRILGKAPIKWRENSPRISLIYASEDGQFGKMKVTGSNKNEKVEVLGMGQQTVIHGFHPSGVRIRINNEGFNFSMNDLPKVTDSKVRSFLEEVSKVLNVGEENNSIQYQSSGVFGNYGNEAFNVEMLRDIVRQMPNNERFEDREEFVSCAHAFACAFRKDISLGKSLFSEWADRWTGGIQKEGEVDTLWRSVEGKNEYGVGADWIVDAAESCGVDVSKYKYESTCAGFTFEDPVPTINFVPGNVAQIATQAEIAIKISGATIFQRGGKLVKPISIEVSLADGYPVSSASFYQMNEDMMTDVLSQIANWERFDGRSKKNIRIDPPLSVVRLLMSRKGSWILPYVSGLVTAPTLRPDGTVLVEGGYDQSTRLFHMKDNTLTLDGLVSQPTQEDAHAALGYLKDLLVEFPFVNEVDRSVALSLLITPVVRGALSVVPMHIVKASTAGSGKSFLVDLASVILTGRRCPVFAAAANNDETEKRLIGRMLSDSPIISIDNCNGNLNFDTLCQAIERPIISVRPLEPV